MRIAIIHDDDYLYLYNIHNKLGMTIVDIEDNVIVQTTHLPLDIGIQEHFVPFLYLENISCLITGYLSKLQRESCYRHDIRVITGISGRAQDVLAWFSNTCVIHNKRSAMTQDELIPQIQGTVYE